MYYNFQQRSALLHLPYWETAEKLFCVVCNLKMWKVISSMQIFLLKEWQLLRSCAIVTAMLDVLVVCFFSVGKLFMGKVFCSRTVMPY